MKALTCDYGISNTFKIYAIAKKYNQQKFNAVTLATAKEKEKRRAVNRIENSKKVSTAKVYSCARDLLMVYIFLACCCSVRIWAHLHGTFFFALFVTTAREALVFIGNKQRQIAHAEMKQSIQNDTKKSQSWKKQIKSKQTHKSLFN